MKKPEKKEYECTGSVIGGCGDAFIDGYNEACNEWEAYHKQEIKTLSDWHKEWADSLFSEEPMNESPLNGEA